MSTPAKVTRTHRELAIEVVNGPDFKWRGKDIFEHYAETGKTVLNGRMMTFHPGSVAQAIADAEERGREGGVFAGRAIERADVVAECERTERLSSVEGSHAVMAMRVRIQRGQHVRKAEASS